jgi:hypothetical protein
MRFWRLLLISIFIIAILTTSSLAAIKTVTYTSELFANKTPPGKLVGAWTDNHTMPYFDPALGRLISVDFTATLNASLNGYAQNLAGDPVAQAYMRVYTDMYVEMINGQHLPLNVFLRIPNDPSDYIYVGPTPDSFSGTDAADTWGSVYYTDSADTTGYIGTGTFKLKTVTHADSKVVGGASWNSAILTRAWSYAKITYAYDKIDTLCLSGHKIDGCTGRPLPGWTIIVNNSTGSWNAVTNASGFWRVCNLKNGTYTVREVLQPGWIQISLPASYTETLAGFNLTNINFTNKKLLCISGFKINSSTGLGLPGWNITLKNATGTVTKKTGPNGKFEFCNLLPGSYSLTEEMLPGYMVVKKVYNPFTLGCENITNKNFTNQKVPNLCGVCWPAGRPQYLALTYTGQTCTANCNVQAAGKVIVTGDPAGATPVHRTTATVLFSAGTSP